jgi:hypothetical protein
MNYIKEEIEKGKINWYPDTDNILLKNILKVPVTIFYLN